MNQAAKKSDFNRTQHILKAILQRIWDAAAVPTKGGGHKLMTDQIVDALVTVQAAMLATCTDPLEDLRLRSTNLGETLFERILDFQDNPEKGEVFDDVFGGTSTAMTASGMFNAATPQSFTARVHRLSRRIGGEVQSCFDHGEDFQKAEVVVPGEGSLLLNGHNIDEVEADIFETAKSTDARKLKPGQRIMFRVPAAYEVRDHRKEIKDVLDEALVAYLIKLGHPAPNEHVIDAVTDLFGLTLAKPEPVA